MKEQDKYNNVIIDQMQQSDVIVFLVDLIEDLSLDSGGDVNAIDSSRISEKICEALFTKYKSWDWGMAKYCSSYQSHPPGGLFYG